MTKLTDRFYKTPPDNAHILLPHPNATGDIMSLCIRPMVESIIIRKSVSSFSRVFVRKDMASEAMMTRMRKALTIDTRNDIVEIRENFSIKGSADVTYVRDKKTAQRWICSKIKINRPNSFSSIIYPKDPSRCLTPEQTVIIEEICTSLHFGTLFLKKLWNHQNKNFYDIERSNHSSLLRWYTQYMSMLENTSGHGIKQLSRVEDHMDAFIALLPRTNRLK